MAEPKYSLSSDPSKVNPYGAPEEQLNEYQQSLKDQIAALEQRYAQPNWFKIAAGFAKPQLGGFMASLGSASEALGENVEQERAAALPIAQMRAQLAQSNILTGQNKTQADKFAAWKASGLPMDGTTYADIVAYNKDSPIAEAAKKYFEGAKAGLDITTSAAEATARLPQLGTALENYTKFQLNPDADVKAIKQSQDNYINQLNNAMPPQMEKATWMALSIPDKQKAVDEYARRQLENGMNTEAGIQQQAIQAPSRLALLGSIRDLAMGVGLKDIEKDGKVISGRDQMAPLFNYFGGNNPFDVLSNAAANGKLGERLADIDKYARQSAMSPEARDHFQKLSKLLAENQLTLRNSAVNPTDQFSALQMAGTPNIANTQTALVTLVDLMGHGEKNLLDKYRYVLDNRVPFRQLGVDPDYLAKQSEYAKEHRKIATSNPFENPPSWYNPAAGAKPKANPKPEVNTNTTVVSNPSATATQGASNLTREAIRAEIAKREAAKKQNP
jgi:hypothetical protein